MSSRHARIEPSFGRWVLTDTESKNGSIVDGHTTKRAVLTDGSLIELGHTLFIFFERLPIERRGAGAARARARPTAPPGLATLMPAWQHELDAAAPDRVVGDPDADRGRERHRQGGDRARDPRPVAAAAARSCRSTAARCPRTSSRASCSATRRARSRGAQTDHPGLVRSADGGTLFLDEIGDLPPSSQAALLRVLQEREVMPVGGTRAVRSICASSPRRTAISTTWSPSRASATICSRASPGSASPCRRSPSAATDLGLLIGALHTRIFPAEHPGFDIDAARLLLRYPWPLNVRELEQALATAQVLAGAEPVRAEHLPDTVRTGRPPGAPRPVVLSETDQKVRDQVVAALREHQGNVSAVARALDKDRKQIQRWIKRFGLDPSTVSLNPGRAPLQAGSALYASTRCAHRR